MRHHWMRPTAVAPLLRRAMSSRVDGISKNVFAEISQLAAQHGAVNLGQGFPSFHTPE